MGDVLAIVVGVIALMALFFGVTTLRNRLSGATALERELCAGGAHPLLAERIGHELAVATGGGTPFASSCGVARGSSGRRPTSR